MGLTAEGRAALARAHAILAQAEALAGAYSRAREGPRARLRIGVTAALTVAERARVTLAWKRTWRGAPIEVDSGFSRDLIPALKQGRLDFALVGLPGEVSGLETRAVSTSPLVAALPSRHRLARRKRVSLLEVTDLPLFWIPRTHNPAYHDFCTDYFRRIGYRPQLVVVEPGQLQTLERIAAGEGWTIPNGATLATRVRGVAYRPLAEGADLAVRVVAAWRPPDGDGRYARLAAAAAKALRPGASAAAR